MTDQIQHWHLNWVSSSEKASKAFMHSALQVADGVSVRTLVAEQDKTCHKILAARREVNGEAEYHKDTTDITLILAGEAILIGGGTIPEVRMVSAEDGLGPKIVGGVSYQLEPGDLVSIPPQTPHQFLLDPGKSLTYVTIKVREAPKRQSWS